jgi:hypothetical protein
MTRINANRAIIAILLTYVEKHPQLRFSQLMQMLGVVEGEGEHTMLWHNDFYLEPEELLRRIKNVVPNECQTNNF